MSANPQEIETNESIATETQPESIHDALEKAFDKHTVDTPEQTTPAADKEAKPETQSTEGRDAAGRFTPKRGDKAEAAAEQTGASAPAIPKEAGDTATEATPQVDKFVRPPASWKAEEALHWTKAPVEVREAVMRREVEINRALQETATARQAVASLQETIAPYIQNINAANGGDVVGSIKRFFEYDNRLRHGSQIEKAQAITTLIRGYGVDIAALDNELAGAAHDPQQVNQSAIQAALARELAPIRDYMTQQQRSQQQQHQIYSQQLEQTVEAFGNDPKNRHYDAVRNDMADLLDIAGRNQQQMSLQEAYERACWQNPHIRSILLSESQQQTAPSQAQAAQKAKAAAVGVKNAPAAAPRSEQAGNGRDNRSADIAAAMDRLGGNE